MSIVNLIARVTVSITRTIFRITTICRERIGIIRWRRRTLRALRQRQRS